MAVGFTPKHVEEFALNELTHEQFLAIASEAIKKMGWEIRYASNNGFIAHVGRGMFEWHAEVKIKMEGNSAVLNSSSTGSEMMDMGKNKKNIKNFIAELNELKTAFSNDELALKYEELKIIFPPAEEDILILPPPTTVEKMKGFLSLFTPQPGYFFTPVIININILIFLLMAFSGVHIIAPEGEDLLKWGANFRPATLAGEWWRLLTCCFLHIGLFHLLMNMYALIYIGILLEPVLGRSKFITAYLITGIAASVTSLWWHDITISAGASGAIFGMYGVFLALLTTNLIEKNTRKDLLASIAFFVGYNLLNGLKGGIDNAAHIGGLLSGLIIGYAYVPGLKKPENKMLQFGTAALLVLLLFIPSFIVYTQTPNDIGTYDEKMEEFGRLETTALAVYHLPHDASKDKVLNAIERDGIYKWSEIIKLLDEMEKLDVPVELRIKSSKLRKYTNLRIDSYRILYKSVNEDTDQYDIQLKNYNKEIEAVINDLNDD